MDALEPFRKIDKVVAGYVPVVALPDDYYARVEAPKPVVEGLARAIERGEVRVPLVLGSGYEDGLRLIDGTKRLAAARRLIAEKPALSERRGIGLLPVIAIPGTFVAEAALIYHAGKNPILEVYALVDLAVRVAEANGKELNPELVRHGILEFMSVAYGKDRDDLTEAELIQRWRSHARAFADGLEDLPGFLMQVNPDWVGLLFRHLRILSNPWAWIERVTRYRGTSGHLFALVRLADTLGEEKALEYLDRLQEVSPGTIIREEELKTRSTYPVELQEIRKELNAINRLLRRRGADLARSPIFNEIRKRIRELEDLIEAATVI